MNKFPMVGEGGTSQGTERPADPLMQMVYAYFKLKDDYDNLKAQNARLQAYIIELERQ